MSGYSRIIVFIKIVILRRFCKYLDNGLTIDKSTITRTERLLTEQKSVTEFEKIELKNKFSSNEDDSKLKNSEKKLSLNEDLKNASKQRYKRHKKLLNTRHVINKDSEQISYIYNYIRSIDYSIKDTIQHHSEKLVKYNLNDIVRNEIIEEILCKDNILIHSIPLYGKISTILYSIFEDINYDIAIKSINISLVSIFTYKYSAYMNNIYSSLYILPFLTIMIICLSQLFYIMGEYEIQKELEHIIVRKKEAIKERKEKLKDLDNYKKFYKYRYDKRIGLGKLDCYCEKKIFSQIDKVYMLADTTGVNKNSFKKEILRKYGLHVTVPNFFFLISLVIYVLECINYHIEFFKDGLFKANKDIINNIIITLGDILVYVIPIIFVFVIIYVLIKIEKYERLRARKGKMNAKEYFIFCKEIFK
ncbi:variable surface protein [Plasmodium gonderi]|uniref:Variable surface protein n=1 Tax=Plasmodium gonderi TaxID=77519 RepID=A0A1Y1JVL3_PLAGO|nr:variable surface protein [Plasmodium gonderi]GAW83934.1 variable surface protein [Plasmodium gonderi]